MSAGRIEQVGAPLEIYRAPRTRFAAGFVGTMNFLAAEIDAGHRLVVAGTSAALAGAPRPGAVTLAIRPEHVEVVTSDSPHGAAALRLPGTIRKTIFLGREAHLKIDTPSGPVTAELLDPSPAQLELTGAAITLRLAFSRLRGFDADGAALALEFVA